jgi:hypothetical protein
VLIGPAATFHSINACITAFLGEQRDTGPFATAPEVRFGH